MEVINFLDTHNGSLTLLTSIVTVIATIYIARMPYKKVITISIVLYDSRRFKKLYSEDETIKCQIPSQDDYLNGYSVADVNVTNVGLCVLAIKKIEISKKSIFRQKVIESYELGYNQKSFLSPMKLQNLRIPIKGKPDELKSELSKLVISVYFEGGIKKIKFKNCIICN